MFTFDAIEQSLYCGVSSDRVPNAIKNRSSISFGCNELDTRIQFEMSERQICILYYDHDYKNCEWKPNGVKDNDYFKEVGFITLTRPKDTGNDILEFPQNVYGMKDLFSFEGEDGKNVLYDRMMAFIKQCKEEYFNFPFLINYEIHDEAKTIETHNGAKKVTIDMFRCFMRCCLLKYIYEFECKGQAFGGSPVYNVVHDKLCESDVYRLLSEKIQYSQYLNRNKHNPQNQEKYTYYTQKFTDRLMDKRINKVISPDNYVNIRHCLCRQKKQREEWKQGWFFNPEIELDIVLDKNRKQQDFKKLEFAQLKESLVSKIQSFFYSKHAVFKAMTTKRSRWLFGIAQVCMLLFNVLLIFASCSFDKKWWSETYVFGSLLLLGLSAVVCLFFSSYCNRTRTSLSNVFFLRIIVAEATAWFTIGIVDDLVKGMLWTEQNVVAVFAIIVVLLLVVAVVFGKTKHHSPYCDNNTLLRKSLLIINHSLFFALVMGCIMQFAFYSNLLKNSDILSSVVYRSHFAKVEDYLDRLNDLEKSINDYRDFARDFDFSNTQISGNNMGKTTLFGKADIVNQDSLMNSINLHLENQIGFSASMASTVGVNLSEYHNELVNNIKSCIREADVPIRIVQNKKESFIYKYLEVINGQLSQLSTKVIQEPQNHLTDHSFETLKNVLVDNIIKYIQENSIELYVIEKTAEKEDDSIIIYRNLEVINGRLSQMLKKEIRESKNHLMDNGYETLINWATVNGTIENQTQSKKIKNLIIDAEKNKCCIKVPCIRDKYFYPHLLLFHTLIVLVLAFITQLIISDKSLTEPL